MTSPAPSTPESKLKFWLALIPVISLVLSFGGSYGGSKLREGEKEARCAAVEIDVAEIKKEIKSFGDRYATNAVVTRFMDDQAETLKRIERNVDFLRNAK